MKGFHWSEHLALFPDWIFVSVLDDVTDESSDKERSGDYRYVRLAAALIKVMAELFPDWVVVSVLVDVIDES